MQAFALLKCGVSQSIVAKIFRVAQTSISHLANCLGRSPDLVWRYRDVMDEWNSLGEEKFIAAYLTEANYLMAEKLRHRVILDDVGGLHEPHLASNPRADGCSYGIIKEFDVGNFTARIDWAPCSSDVPEDKRGPDGWRWADVSTFPLRYNGRLPYEEPVREDGLYMPFRTSGDAFDYLFLSNGLRSPRRGGRPRKT